MSKITQQYEMAKEAYAALGVSVDKALEILDSTPVSYHCWQGDDVTGFENFDGGLTGGIQATGNHPGKARNAQELRQDLEKFLSYVPGKNKVSLHASYLEADRPVDRNEIEPAHFAAWADWAVERRLGLDFNPTYFSHPKSEPATLSSRDEEIRKFWVEHGIRSRKIAEYFGKRCGMVSTNNIWIPDGEKEFPIDTIGPRMQLKRSLDEMTAEKIDDQYALDSVECKLFGIGSESYVVGSHEFYMGYVCHNQDLLLTLDTGHFHPTELVSAKLSALLPFVKGILLHVSRPVRWDSDHVVAFDDETRCIMREIVRLGALDRVYIATDYFDASVNRLLAWGVGARNTKKALLEALLQPVEQLKTFELDGDLGARLAYTEELKTMPFEAVWDYYCEKNSVPTGFSWIEDARAYEREVLFKRG